NFWATGSDVNCAREDLCGSGFSVTSVGCSKQDLLAAERFRISSPSALIGSTALRIMTAVVER
ncbi:hypothetical protein ATANTOWER_011899, partial [Ataeniobius toweri]|nr:hypothetical protein [Ataeniobius toweri]